MFLEREFEGNYEESRYTFRLVSKSLQIVQFIADFTGSVNVEFYDDFKKPLSDKIIFKSLIESTAGVW